MDHRIWQMVALCFAAGIGTQRSGAITPVVEIPESAIGLVHREWPQGSAQPVVLRIRGKGDLAVSAEDVRLNQEVWRARVDLSQSAEAEVEAPLSFGVYRLRAVAEGVAPTETWLGVVPPFRKGTRPDSFFASNVSDVRKGRDLDLLEAIGMKVQRAHFHRVTRADFEELIRRHSWVLPIIGYADPLPKTELAERLRQHGPPADVEAFVRFWLQRMADFPEIRTWEFWNEPWIFGWTWADTPAAYRRLQTLMASAARRLPTPRRLVAGSSWMFVQDHIEGYPESWQGLIHGISHHPYAEISALTFRSGAMRRSIDGGFLVARRMGLDYYLTESGTNVGAPDHGGANPHYPTPNNAVNARKIVHLFVQAALNGAYQGNAQWGIGYGHGWTQSNAAFAMMTHLLEDRPIVADIWPRQALLNGAIFAHPRHVDDVLRKLPRAAELQARWSVPIPAERADDPVKVAVIWSWTGPAPDRLDSQGALAIEDPGDILAYDLYGRPIRPEGSGMLRVPFSEDPVYLVTERLSASAFHRKLANARIENVTPVNVYVQPLRRPADQAQILSVRLDNQVNVALEGVITLASPGRTVTSAAWHAGAGELVEVPVPWAPGPRNEENMYPVALEIAVRDENGRDMGRFPYSQVLQEARIVRKTIRVDGEAADWDTVPAVRITARGQQDFTRYLLNPNLPAPKDEAESTDAVLTVRVAYDDQFIYFAVAGVGLRSRVGQLHFDGLPYKKGVPDGLQFVEYEAETVQVGFGFRDRVPHVGRQMDDPWAWKGHFYDTDYLYAVHPTATGEGWVVRQWGPDTDRRTAYQTDPIPHVGLVDGASAVLRQGFWEFAIPRKEIAMFSPEIRSVRLGVLINGRHNLSDAFNVFDYWRGSGSFNPAWESRVAAQVVWALE